MAKQWLAVLAWSAAQGLCAAPTLPVIPAAVYNVAAYGAVGDGVATNTVAIQGAINAAKTNTAGGAVEIPAGIFLCGPILLANGVNLQLDSGAILRMLPFDAYPGGVTSPANFISGNSLHDIEISGTGAIDGQGSPWWRALEANSSISRPLMVSLATCQRVLIQDATFSNAPAQHFSIKGKAGNVTLRRLNVVAPSSSDPVNPSHNTDALDLAETNTLIQDCNITVGDDNVAVGSSSSASSDIVITNCVFGAGHGISIGSFTSGGVSNMVVTDCSFNNTDQGIRIKSDRDRGGLVRNISYLNLSMTNVQYPILIYATYTNDTPPYNSLNNLTPAIVSTYPSAAVTSKTPIYRDILISNVSATAQSGRMAGLIWGLPEMSISNLTLSHVTLTGSKTLGIYDAHGVQILDSVVKTPTGVTAVSVYNTDLAFSNAVPAAAFSLAGAAQNGVGNRLAFYNAPASLIQTNALDSSPGLLLNASVLTVANNLIVAPATFLTFALGSADARLSVTGSLALFSRINLTNGPGFHPGTYTLCASVGSFSGQPSLGSKPAGYTCILDTSVPQQLNVIVTSPSRVQAWGDDSDGQTETFPALSNAVAVVAGGFHNLALQSDGSVLAWGDDSHGQTAVPPTLTNVISIAAGAYHSLAALADGSVVAWGDNSSNQIAVPLTATNVVAVAAGDWHSLALRSDGSVAAWGDNTWGQCDVPSAASNVVALAAGKRHSLALRADGSVIAWGGNLGADGSYLGQAVAPDLRHVAAIAAGGFQSLALTTDGQVIGWGSPLPPPLTNATAIAAGWNSGLAALTGGTVVGWGDDSCGETNIDPTLAQVTAVAGGACHSLALQGAPPPPLLLLGPNLEGDNFTVAVPTVRGRPVFLLSKDLNETNWHFVVGAGGSGLVQTLRDPSVSPTQRFYQVRQ
ncbi:MAG TPA: glycosyl hydrolase family 28 protein [Verrucomicrobiae bacterium]|jgi:hypothetical protein|nr:glycosyl hydrolase family 28 protein [Verrucomicrobiae bacterium]